MNNFQLIPTALRDVQIFVPKRFEDHRGFFSEVFSQSTFHEFGLDVDFVQDNHSMSREVNVVRGLHYQLPPFAQAKLLRVVHGAVLDVIVDIRRASPTFGKMTIEIISAENWRQIFVPVGFAHGFRTLEPNTEVLYRVSNIYSPEHERGIRWNDPALKIDWGIESDLAILSPRDTTHPLLADAPDLF